MPENFAVIYLKFKQIRQNCRVNCQKDVNGMANSEDADQTAHQLIFSWPDLLYFPMIIKVSDILYHRQLKKIILEPKRKNFGW